MKRKLTYDEISFIAEDEQRFGIFQIAQEIFAIPEPRKYEVICEVEEKDGVSILGDYEVINLNERPS